MYCKKLNEIVMFDPSHMDDDEESGKDFAGGYIKMAKLGGYTVFGEKGDTDKLQIYDYYVVDRRKTENNVVLRCSLKSHEITDPTTNLYYKGPVVEYIYIYPEYRGKGLGYGFYEFLLKRHGTVFSDDTHSTGSRAIWKKLAKEYKVRMFKPFADTLSKKPLKKTGLAYNDSSYILVASVR